jgi:general secretion pathway protein B
MSVILDALRKLDREKSSRRSEVANIAAEILRPDLPHPGKRIPLYIATVSLTAIAAVVITYAVIVEFGFLSKSLPPAPANPSAPRQQVEPASLESGVPSASSPPVPAKPPVARQQVAPVPLSREPVRDGRDEISRVPPKIQSPVESNTPTTSLSEKKASQNVTSEEKDVAPGNTKKHVESSPNVSATTPPSLKLSAIVWYEDPSKRFAMINGVITTEGSLIEGVKVVEINPTSVRFLHNDRSFEISLSQ